MMAAHRAALALLLVALAEAAGRAGCNPKDDVCHDCKRICSTRRGDKTLTLNTACQTECEVAIYNCDEGNPTNKEELAECIEEALHAVIEEHGDLSTKLIYDVPPSFKELDELKQEDGCIRKEDMKVLVDILDGSSEKGVTMPTAKADVWAMWTKADTNKDGCVDANEFAAASMGPEFEKDMPVAHHEPVHEAAGKSLKSAGNAAADAAAGAAKAVQDGAAAVGGSIEEGAAAAGESIEEGAAAAGDAMEGETVVEGDQLADEAVEDSPVDIPYAEDGSDAASTEAAPAEAAPAEAAPAEPEASGDGVMDDAAAAGDDAMEDAAEASPVEIPYMGEGEEAAPADAAPAEEAPAEAAPAEPEESGDGLMEDAAAAGDETMEDAAEASPVAIPYMDGDGEAPPAEAAPAEAAPAEAAPAEGSGDGIMEDAAAAGDGIMEDMIEESPVMIPYAEAQQTSLHRPHRSAPQRRLRSLRRVL